MDGVYIYHNDCTLCVDVNEGWYHQYIGMKDHVQIYLISVLGAMIAYGM